MAFPLQNVSEVLIFLNGRDAAMDALVAPYTQPPYLAKVLGDNVNHQIARAMYWLMGNASNDHVLFLEKDFRLVESLDCAMQQLGAGVDIIIVRAGSLLPVSTWCTLGER